MQSEELTVLMIRLRACYPQKVGDGDHWKAMVVRYQEELAAFPDAVVANALKIAWRQFPEFFPALGELADFCSQVAKRRASVSLGKQIQEFSSAPGIVTPEIRAAIDSVKSIR